MQTELADELDFRVHGKLLHLATEVEVVGPQQEAAARSLDGEWLLHGNTPFHPEELADVARGILGDTASEIGKVTGLERLVTDAQGLGRTILPPRVGDFLAADFVILGHHTKAGRHRKMVACSAAHTGI